MPVMRMLKCYKCKATRWQGDVIIKGEKIVLLNPTDAQKKCNHKWENNSLIKDFLSKFK